MKITLVAVIALFTATTPFALAQEESAPPAASPEATASDPSVSITTEKTPPKPKAPKPATSPSPNKSSSPAAKSSPSPAPSKSSSPTAKSSPSASPSTSSSTSAVMPAQKSTPEATLREIEDKWEGSVMNHDSAIPQAYLADDFHGVSSKGKLMKKSDLIGEIKKDTDVYSSTKNGKVDVRVFNGQFAVATGTSTEVGKTKDGQEFKRTFRWTDAWVLRNDKWQCVASQAMLVK